MSTVRVAETVCPKIWTCLVDLSGTLHVENDTIPGAIEALARLRSAPINIRFVTNTTKESASSLLTRLHTVGFNDIFSDEIFTSLTAARRYVESATLRPLLFLEPSALEDFSGIPTDNPNAVVVGLAPSQFNYQRLNEAFRLLLGNPESKLIAIHKGRYYKKADGLALGPGPFVTALEYATGKEAIAVGKPEKAFFLEGLSKFVSASPEKTFMIGDDARDDIDGSQAAGLKGILVKTGKYRDGDENILTAGNAWAVADNFAQAVDKILKFIEENDVS